MKTFKDLQFKDHSSCKYTTNSMYKGAKQAVLEFNNGYGVSVLLGSCFYSNGIDTFELAVLYKGEIAYNTDITDDVLGYITEDLVTMVMKRVQNL